MRKAIGLILALLLALLAACGGNTAAPTLSISPESLTVTAGDAAVTLTASLSGSSETINWALSPALGSISPTTGATVSYTPPERVETPQTVTITASAGSLSKSVTVTVNPHLVNVAGTTLNAFGVPTGGLRVEIPGKGVVFSDTSGNFTFEDVVAPYTLILEGNSTHYYVYEGLTSSAPVVYANNLSSSWRSASVDGTIAPTTAGNSYAVQYASSYAWGVATGATSDTSTSYINTSALKVGSTRDTYSGSLYALVWSVDANGNADSFISYGEYGSLALANGGAFSGKDMTLVSISTTNDFNVAFSAPSGYTVSTFKAGLRLGGAGLLTMPIITHSASSPASSPVTVKSPAISGALMQALVVASDASSQATFVWDSAPATASGLTLTAPEPPSPSAPADGASNVAAGTAFSWELPTTGFSMLGISGPVNIQIFTDKTETTLPDLSGFGVSYTSGDSYTWTVYGVALPGVMENVEQLVSPDKPSPFYVMLSILLNKPLSDSGYLTYCAQRSFTIQ
ncbi:hypothetical protein [Oceanithermus sp.]